ncbi:unnamed protein product [Cunninghamella blakesleeana]
MKLNIYELAVFLVSILSVEAFLKPGYRLHRNQINTLSVKPKINPRYGPYFFNQTIDHESSDTTTFKQRYWVNSDWYKTGGPVILYNAGEMDAEERSHYVTNSSMALLARELEGIVIVLEHRSYGVSQPGPDYSTKYLKTLTTYNALEDMATIIRNLKIPNLDVDLPPAPTTRWIVYGGSYSGNLAAFLRLKYPDIVFASIPSSAPVEMKYNFYEYFQPIQKYGDEHCIKSIESVIRYVDHILLNPFNYHGKKALKKQFGVEDIQHDDDFAELLTYPLGLWQAKTPDHDPFGKFCTIFDNTTTLHETILAYANYIETAAKDACGDEPINRCLDTHDPKSPQYTDLKAEHRAWMYQVCTEYAYWQTGAPIWQPSIVSRKLTTRWYQRQCPLLYGEHDIPFRPKWRDINKEYQGWHLKLTRTFWIDGLLDPWRTLSVNSDNAPCHGDAKDSEYVILPTGVHHWDFFVSDYVHPSIKEVQQKLIETLKKWINEDEEEKKNIDEDDHPPKLIYQTSNNDVVQ